MTDWDQFEAGLSEALATLPAGALVTVGTKAPDAEPGFAQFAQFDDRLWAELGAYEQLDRDAGLDAPGAPLALAAGWHPPDDRGSDNWWVEVPWPVTTAVYRNLAAMVVLGLRDVFRVADPTRLVYDAWNDRDGNRRFELPTLGIDQQ